MSAQTRFLYRLAAQGDFASSHSPPFSLLVAVPDRLLIGAEDICKSLEADPVSGCCRMSASSEGVKFFLRCALFIPCMTTSRRDRVDSLVAGERSDQGLQETAG